MKIKKLQKLLKDGEMYLVTSEVSRMYMTDFRSSDGFLCITCDNCEFFTDSRYIEAAQNEITECESVLYRSFDCVKDFVSANSVKKIITESERLTVAEFNRFKKIFNEIEVSASDELDNEISKMRMIKSADEIMKIKTAQKIAEKALDEVLKFIKVGVTERQVASFIEYSMRNNGGDGVSFDTIVVSGHKSSMPHGVPDDKVIENGDFVTMDFGCIYKGYMSDMTRTVAVGCATDKMKNVYDIVLKAQCNAIDNIKAGISGKTADSFARDIIENAGYGEYFGHSTGHGVGIEIHESPNLSPKNEKPLEAGNIVTVEPGIYLPGEFGVRIEDFGMVSVDGFENFTSAEKKLIILS